MKNQFLLASLAVVVALASCSKNEVVNTGGEPESDDIRAVATTVDVETKAPVNGTDATGVEAYVLTSQTSGEYTNQSATYGTGKIYSSGAMTFATAAVSYDANTLEGGSKKLPVDKSDLYAVAIYPYENTMMGSAIWTISAGVANSFQFEGYQDIMAAPEVTIQKGGTEVAAFTFKHLLTKVEVKLKADDADAITTWGQVQKIVLKQIDGAATFKNSVKINLKDATAPTTTAFTAPSFLPLSEMKFYSTVSNVSFDHQTLALTEAAFDQQNAVAYCLIPPFVSTARADGDLVLGITTKTTFGAAIETLVPVSIPAGDTQAKAYTVQLTFKTKDIKGTATVTAWDDQTPIDAPVE